MTIPAGFSFLYGDQPSAGLLSAWRRPGPGQWEATDSGLVITEEHTRYADSDVTEWLLRLRNRGSRNTPILSDILPLDITVSSEFARGSEADFVLHFFQGSNADAHDYEPLKQALGGNGAAAFELTTRGGRSSNFHMPFFNVQTGAESGLFIAIGWSGQWKARFEVTGDGKLRIKAGMEQTRFYLKPGEEVRTPRMVIMPWAGGLADSWNQWRRFLRAHKSPRLDGKECLPRTWANTWFTFDCGYGVNEKNQIETLEAAADLGIEFMVIDAGWYDCPHPFWWDGVGNWDRPRKDAFPNGFAPLFKAAKEKEIGFGVWFEPERAELSSEIARAHPDWILGTNPQWTTTAATVDVRHTSGLLDFGRAEVQDWLIGLVDRYVAQGMLWFRHDFNLDPLDIWRQTDSPDRQGITEIRYIEGLYRIYDAILERHPTLFVEGCASGGRRLDIETIARNHGYWASDLMDGAPEPMQSHLMGFNHLLLPHWHHGVLRDPSIPLEDTPANRYRFFSFLGGGPCFGFDLRNAAIDRPLLRRWLELFKSIRHLTEGDYHPLTEIRLGEEHWAAFQFHRTDLNAGLVACFRRPQAPDDTLTVRLRGLDPDSIHTFRSLFDGQQFDLTGTAAMNALPVKLTHQPDLALYEYSRLR